MINTIIECLKANQEVSAYEIIHKKTKSVQLFYVLNKLETNRYTNNQDIMVNVYHDFDEFRGSSSFVINASDDEESIKRKIDQAVKTAAMVKNPFFKLTDDHSELEKVESINETNLNDVATKCMDAIVKADVYEDGWINSTEIFVTNTVTTIHNSNDVIKTFDRTSLEVELIPTWRNQEGEEFELYLDFKRLEEDYDRVYEEAKKILNQAKWRSIAIPYNESMKANSVVISDEMMLSCLECLRDDLNYANILRNANHYKLGDEIVAYPFNMTLKPAIKGASSSMPFDESGISLKDLVIIKDGKAINNWGSNRFGQYIKVEKPSGTFSVFELSVDESRRIDKPEGPYFELLNFSSPQLDESSGYFGGEVRLALYHDENGNVTPVTSLSLAGNIYESIKDAYYSKNDVTLSNYHGPESIVLTNFKLH